MKILKLILVFVFFNLIIENVNAQVEISNFNLFKKTLENYGYIIKNQINEPNKIIYLTDKNTNFTIYEGSLPTKDLVKIKLNEDFEIYETYDKNQNNLKNYYVSKQIVEFNLSLFNNYIKLFPKFEPSYNLGINRIKTTCSKYKIECYIPIKIYNLVSTSENFFSITKYNYLKSLAEIGYYTELLILLISTFIYRQLKINLFKKDDNNRSIQLTITNHKLYTILSISFIFLIVNLILDLNNFKLISTIFSILILILFKVGFKKILKENLRYIVISIVLVILISFVKIKNVTCDLFSLDKYFPYDKMVKLSFKVSNLCLHNEINLPQNINNKIPLLINGILVFHPDYDSIENINSLDFEKINLENSDVILYSENDNSVLDYIINNKNKLSQLKHSDTNTILTNESSVYYSVKCLSDVKDNYIKLTRYEKINKNFTTVDKFTSQFINCKKNETLNLSINNNDNSSYKLINFQNNDNFELNIEGKKTDYLMGIWLYSNSIQIKKQDKTKSLKFLNLLNMSNFNVEWNQESRVEKEFNIKINSYLNQILRIGNNTSEDLIISTILPNSLIFNQNYKF